VDLSLHVLVIGKTKDAFLISNIIIFDDSIFDSISAFTFSLACLYGCKFTCEENIDAIFLFVNRCHERATVPRLLST
jgi:hypothetical protein